ncbi:hypothetical protein Daus18300_005779 [Diaporthe australafricana]|uniref:Nudix hydrolase domain-containing protein n=1 Tax=Diaporthe australafricana TaxID=127596 RepID=A0ABR3WZ90_9PEZI
MAECPVFKFDHDPSVAEFTLPKHSYLAARPDAPFGYIAASSLVLDSSSSTTGGGAAGPPRVLLLQRAAADEDDPNKWEPPGGACDDGDASILHAAARELWEEAGLEVTRVEGLVGRPFFFDLSGGGRVCQFHFAMQVRRTAGCGGEGGPPAVRLDPVEHQRFVWATEDEARAGRAGRAGDVELDFTMREVQETVLLAFGYFRKVNA